jgi:hypothetical protein
VASVVYLLGAGFNLSVVSGDWPGVEPPLSRTFFQVLMRSGRFREKLDGIRTRIYVDQLLAEIERYWHLSLNDLETAPFDIEECLTLFESLVSDDIDASRALDLQRADFALKNLLHMYLADVGSGAPTPSAEAFARDILMTGADVLTLNYDDVAERLLESASGLSPQVGQPHADPSTGAIPDEALDARFHNWNRSLALGFRFDELFVPVPGVLVFVPGERYYARPSNQLYAGTRVLKLHGSIDWLRYTGQRLYPVSPEDSPMGDEPPSGLVLDRHPTYWMAGPEQHSGWLMEPQLIPPTLYKKFAPHPFQLVWDAVVTSLSECVRLVVVGYSFPPTDFRLRRLFLEAFSEHSLRELTVVNPDGSVLDTVRQLTHFDGPAVTARDLPSLYDLPRSWLQGR